MSSVKIDPDLAKMDGWPSWDDVLPAYAATAFAVDTRLGAVWYALSDGDWPVGQVVELSLELTPPEQRCRNR